MPCSDPHLTDREERTYRVARLWVEVYELCVDYSIERPPQWVRACMYPGHADKLDSITQVLCRFCRRVPEQWLYNGRYALNRQLADWYQKHCQDDKAAGR